MIHVARQVTVFRRKARQGPGSPDLIHVNAIKMLCRQPDAEFFLNLAPSFSRRAHNGKRDTVIFQPHFPFFRPNGKFFPDLGKIPVFITAIFQLKQSSIDIDDGSDTGFSDGFIFFVDVRC